MVDFTDVRESAMDLFELCLTEGIPDPLTEFVHEQILYNPPRLDVLQGVAEDLHQQLVMLRESHFDVRDRLLRLFQDVYAVDLSQLAPANLLDNYHQLSPDQILEFLKPRTAIKVQEVQSLRKIIENSLSRASQLHGDVLLTKFLLDYVLDWTDGISTVIIRDTWSFDFHSRPTVWLH
jgi:hypothetical protein